MKYFLELLAYLVICFINLSAAAFSINAAIESYKKQKYLSFGFNVVLAVVFTAFCIKLAVF